jgi:hypothetical protein
LLRHSDTVSKCPQRGAGLVVDVGAIRLGVGRGGVEQARAVQVQGQAARARQLRHLGDVGRGQHLTAGGVLQHHQAGVRAKCGSSGLMAAAMSARAQRAVGLCFHGLRLDGAQHRHAATLPAVGVPALAHDGLVAALAVAHEGDQVGLRARGREQRGLEAQQLRRVLLQCVDGGVVAEHVVAQWRGLHGRAHGGCGLGDGVAAEIGHGWFSREEAAHGIGRRAGVQDQGLAILQSVPCASSLPV